MATPQPQANPKPHPIDYLAIGLLLIAAVAQLASILPAQYSGAALALFAIARTYTKWLGSQQDQAALAQGEALGKDLQGDLSVMTARKPGQ